MDSRVVEVPGGKVELRRDAEAGLAWLVFDRPKGNVLTRAALDAASRLLVEAGEDRELRLLVLRGAGGHFSFGASVEEHRREEARAMLEALHGFVRRLVAFPAPTAALVEGRCLGGGFEVVLACRLVFAAENATCGCPEIRLGVFPPAFAAFAPHRLPLAMAERLMLTGDSLDAAALDRAGLLAMAPVPAEETEARVRAWYREKFAPLSAFALRQATAAIRLSSGLADAAASLDLVEGQYVREVLPSHDGNEGITAFLEKRRPAWRHS